MQVLGLLHIYKKFMELQQKYFVPLSGFLPLRVLGCGCLGEYPKKEKFVRKIFFKKILNKVPERREKCHLDINKLMLSNQK